MFLWAKNQSGHPATTSDNFEVVDTQGNVYRPVQLNPALNLFAWTAQPLANLGTEPGPNTPASLGPTQGGLLLFKVNSSAYSNRPLTLWILGREPKARRDLAQPLTCATAPARRRWVVGLAVATLALLPSAGLPAAAQARWSAPFDFAQPGTLDVVAPVLAISGSGAAAAAFGIQDVDTPGVSQAYVTLRPAQGTPGTPIALPGAEQVLAASYASGALNLLTGAGVAHDTCCSSAQAVQVGGGGQVGRPRTLVSGLSGAAQGQLLTLRNGSMLAAVATERGVWVAQSAKADRFGACAGSPAGVRCPRPWRRPGWAASARSWPGRP